jgi:hypothetical protein
MPFQQQDTFANFYTEGIKVDYLKELQIAILGLYNPKNTSPTKHPSNV